MSDCASTPTALAVATPQPLNASGPAAVDISSGVFSGIAAFEAAQRMAQALCTSTMVPSDYRGQQGLSNSLIALEIAARMGLSPLVVMQNMTPIHGKPSWSSSFLIATVNASGRFSPLRFVFDDKNSPTSCYAVARDKATGELLEGETISIAMAKREGWWSRPDRHGKETSKWQSMTGQMLRYRAAAFWVKVYCPEISLGLMTQEEVADVQSVDVAEVRPEPAPAQPLAISPADAEVITPARRPSKRPAAAPKQLNQPEAFSTGEVAAADPSSDSAASSPATQPSHRADDQSSEAAPQAGDPTQASDLVQTALREIPKLASQEALDNARLRINRLLAEGHLSDAGAERLWSAIDRRLQQLQRASAADEPQEAI
jgi:hypothetical protein